MKFFPRLHWLRGLLALTVVASHLTNPFPTPSQMPLQRCGQAAVPVFFVLSGFVMFQILDTISHGFRPALGFLIKRVFRIFPAYWFFLALTALFILTGHVTYDATKNADHVNWGEGLTLLSFHLTPSLPIRVAWSLIYEMIFYYVLVLVVWNRALGGAALIAYFAFSIFLNHWSPIHLYGLDPYNGIFLGGLILGFLNRRYPQIFPRLIPLLFLGLALSFAFVVFGVTRYVCFLGAILIVAGLLGFEWSSKPKLSGPLPRTLQFLGTVSFSIYVGHILTQSALRYLIGPTTLLNSILFIAAPVLVAFISFTLIEKPGMNFAKWFDTNFILHRPLEEVPATKEL
jgi:exopolysaccharide production protein ExoZ